MMKFDTVLETAIAESIAIREECHQLSPAISEVIDCMVKSYGADGKIIVFGNGGAAADAQHIVGELVGRFRFERPALAAIALVYWFGNQGVLKELLFGHSIYIFYAGVPRYTYGLWLISFILMLLII